MKEIHRPGSGVDPSVDPERERAEFRNTLVPRYEQVRVYLERMHGSEHQWPAYHGPMHNLLTGNRTTFERAVDLVSLASSTGLPYGYAFEKACQHYLPPFLGLGVDKITWNDCDHEKSLRDTLEGELNKRGQKAQAELVKVASLLLGWGDPLADEATPEEQNQVRARLLERGILFIYPSEISEQIQKIQRKFAEAAERARRREGEIRIGERRVAIREGFAQYRHQGEVLFLLNQSDRELPYHCTDSEFLELSRVHWYRQRDPQAQPITELVKQALRDQYEATLVEEEEMAGPYTKAIFAPKPYAVLSVDIAEANRQYTKKLLIGNVGPIAKTGFCREKVVGWSRLQREMEKILRRLFITLEKEGIAEVGMDSLAEDATVPSEIFFQALANVIDKRRGGLPGDLVVYHYILPDFEKIEEILSPLQQKYRHRR